MNLKDLKPSFTELPMNEQRALVERIQKTRITFKIKPTKKKAKGNKSTTLRKNRIANASSEEAILKRLQQIAIEKEKRKQA